MNTTLTTTLSFLLLFTLSDAATSLAQDAGTPISSHVRTTDANERILVQEVWLDAPVAAVWAAYTTEEGWTAWASPKA